MKWTAAWKYLPVNYGTNIGTVENVLQRTCFQNNLRGEKIRLRFSNKYGNAPLVMEQVLAAHNIEEAETGNTEGQPVPVTYRGSGKIVVMPGEEFLSDEIEWHTEPGEDIILYVFLKERQEIRCACSTWSVEGCRTMYHSCCGSGSALMETAGEEGWKESREIFPYVEADVNKANIVVGVSGILLYTDPDVKTFTLFGDSITHMSYFSDGLMGILMEKFPGKASLINCGIGGNRILRDASYVPEMDGNGACFGPAGAGRFEEDVFGDGTPDAVFVLEGVNDIMHPYVFEHFDEIAAARDLEEGVKSMIDTAHRHGCPIYLGTVMPFWDGSCNSWIEEADSIRREFNRWVREESGADGVLDYDKAAADEACPEKLKAGIHIGDWLHPNTAGGQLMARTAYELILREAENRGERKDREERNEDQA